MALTEETVQLKIERVGDLQNYSSEPIQLKQKRLRNK